VSFSPAIPQVSGGRYAIVVGYPAAAATDSFRWAGVASSNDPNRTCLLGVLDASGIQWRALASVCDFQTYVSTTGQVAQIDGGAPKDV
jgi:hypothetical protein